MWQLGKLRKKLWPAEFEPKEQKPKIFRETEKLIKEKNKRVKQMRRYYFAKQLICWESFFARVLKTRGRYFAAQILAQVFVS